MEELRLSLEDERLGLHLGPDSLLAHAPPEPPGPLLLQACRAMVVLASGARSRVTLALPGGALLRLARTDALRLAATLTSGDGLLVIHEAEVPARPFVASLAAAMTGFLQEPHDPRLASAVSQAAQTLADLPDSVEISSTSMDTGRSGPIELAHDGAGRLRLRLGSTTTEVVDVDLPTLADALVDGIEELLQTRDWPPGGTLIPLDGRVDGDSWAGEAPADRPASRHLAVWRGDDLSATVIDDAQHALCPRTLLTVADLAWAALQCLQSATEVVEPARRTLLRLIRWEQALRRPTAATRGAPAGWRAPTPAPSPTEAPDTLPVDRLRHLAWHRIWRREAAGLLRVEPAGRRLYIHADGGLAAVDARSGDLRWRRPEARPLERGDAGLAVDDEGALLSLDARTGRVVWRVVAEDEGPFRGAWRHRRRVLALSDATLFALEEGRTTWRYDTCFGQVHQVAFHGPLAWLTADDGILHALRLADGTRQFALPIQGDPEEGPLVVPQGLVVTTLREPEGRGLLTLCDALTGAIRWRVGLDGPSLAPPVRLADAVVQAHGGTDHVTVECVRLADGFVRWRHRQLPVQGRPRLCAIRAGATEDLVLCKATDGGLLALDPRDGQVRWSLGGEDDEAHLLRNPLPVVCRGVLLVPGATVRAVDPETGRLIRRLDCGELVPAWLHAWPDGDLVIAEDDAVAHYRLGGHLSLV